jgi:hypothetical protein
MAVRPEHLKHLEDLGDTLVMAGPFLDEEGKSTGTMTVIEAPDLASATKRLEADPYVAHGVFGSYEVSRWNWGINNPTKRGQ